MICFSAFAISLLDVRSQGLEIGAIPLSRIVVAVSLGKLGLANSLLGSLHVAKSVHRKLFCSFTTYATPRICKLKVENGKLKVNFVVVSHFSFLDANRTRVLYHSESNLSIEKTFILDLFLI